MANLVLKCNPSIYWCIRQSSLRAGSVSQSSIYNICHLSFQIPYTQKREIYSRLRQTLYKPALQQGLQARALRLSAPNKALPPFVWIILRPVLTFAGAIIGRSTRKWYRGLSPDMRRAARLRIIKFYGLFAALMSSCAALIYWFNREVVPFTGRTRFRTMDDETFLTIADLEFQQQKELFKDYLLNTSDPAVRRVGRVAYKLIEANKDIASILDKKWSITVINKPDLFNAFVLPNGQIVVFTGMLQLCDNDDELGAVLAHEMAHAVLSHGAERLTYTGLVDLGLVAIISAIWAVFPTDVMSVIVTWLFTQMKNIIFEYPYSRTLEKEADIVGLDMAAKACFDVRRASVLWAKMAILEKTTFEMLGLDEESKSVVKDATRFLSTHPNHEDRQRYLDERIDAAQKIRDAARCPKLSSKDPRSDTSFHKELRDMLYKRYANTTLLLPKPSSSE